MPLSGNQRRYLRSLGHHLKAIVQVGHQGVTPALVKQLSGALKDHELVKVKLGESVEDRAAVANELVAGTGSEWVQSLGRTVLVYRARDEKPEIVLPKAHGEPQARGPKSRRKPAEEASLDDEDAVEEEEPADDDEE